MKSPYIVLIRKCTIYGCDEWFIGSPKSRYCDTHKQTQAQKITNSPHPPTASRFTEEEIKEIRWLFHRMSAAEIAKHFNCKRSLIYKYLHHDPMRYRQI